MKPQVEIMSPAGSFEALQAALQAGANSVYFGVDQLHMRAGNTQSFSLSDLPEIATRCAAKNVKTYLTVNTVLYNHDLKIMRKICDAAKAAKISAIIASDMAAIQYCKSIAMCVHISTQSNVCNIEAVKFFAPYSDVIVLARELTLQQIKEICEQIKAEDIRGTSGKPLEIEIFAHGALCVAVSGKCYMSLGTDNASANRGSCRQNCRRSYRVIDEETGEELVLDNKYVMSPKDLCTIGFVDKLIDAGVSVLKLEGRGRAADYVHTVTKAYREAANAHLEGTYNQDKIDAWLKQLDSVYNRGYWHGGYYLGKQLGEWSGEYGSQATQEKVFIGRAKKYFPKAKVAELRLEAGDLKLNDSLLVTGPTTGLVKSTVESIFLDEKSVTKATRGNNITITLNEKVRPNDKVYIIKDRLLHQPRVDHA